MSVLVSLPTASLTLSTGPDTPKHRRRLSLGRLKSYLIPSSPFRATEQPVNLKRLSKHGSISDYDLPGDPFASHGICMSGWTENTDELRRRSESSPRTRRVLQRRPVHLDKSRFSPPSDYAPILSHSPTSPLSSLGPITPTSDVLSFKTFSQEQEMLSPISSPLLLPPDYLDLSTSTLPRKIASWRPKAKDWLKTRKHISSDSSQPPPVPPKDLPSTQPLALPPHTVTPSPVLQPGPVVDILLEETQPTSEHPPSQSSGGCSAVWWIDDHRHALPCADLDYEDALEICAYLDDYFHEEAPERWPPEDHDELPDEENIFTGDDHDDGLGRREDAEIFYTPKSSLSELNMQILAL